MKYLLILSLVSIVAATSGCAGKMTREQALMTAAGLMILKVHRQDFIKDKVQLTATDFML